MLITPCCLLEWQALYKGTDSTKSSDGVWTPEREYISFKRTLSDEELEDEDDDEEEEGNDSATNVSKDMAHNDKEIGAGCAKSGVESAKSGEESAKNGEASAKVGKLF